MSEVLTKEQSSPIYCRNCKAMNTWERYPSGDIISESGKTMWLKYRCKYCLDTAIYPTENIKSKKEE